MAQATYRCSICQYETDSPYPPARCPVCAASRDKFIALSPAPENESPPEQTPSLHDYLSQWSREEYESEEKFSIIQKISKTGVSEISPMGTRKSFPGLDTILFRGSQFHRFPLDEDQEVNTSTIIGPNARHPLVLDIPYFVSHMSFGALSKEAKIALAIGASRAGTATGSGEGGLLPEEREHGKKVIYEIGTALYGRDTNAMLAADAVEIKFGQAAKPGMGGHLPGAKVTPEIAQLRNIQVGEDFISPNFQPDITCPEDLKKMVAGIRETTDGRPVGIKFSAGHIEADLKFVLQANPDFITVDCRGGATGAAPNFIRDHICLPAIYTIRRVRKYLDQSRSRVTFCVTGGFRDSTDIAKAIALGADCVALATSSLLAIGCQQYRICNTGKCPVGITTQDPELRKRFSIPASADRFSNFCTATTEELKALARVNGRQNIHDLNLDDIFTISNEISVNTDIKFA